MASSPASANSAALCLTAAPDRSQAIRRPRRLEKATKASKGTPREQAEKKAYIDEKGVLYVPGMNIYASIIEGGKFIKIGKAKATNSKSSLIPAAMILEEERCTLGTKSWEVDSRSVVIPATGGRIMAYRPRLDEWECSFTIDLFDPDILAPSDVRQIIDDFKDHDILIEEVRRSNPNLANADVFDMRNFHFYE